MNSIIRGIKIHIKRIFFKKKRTDKINPAICIAIIRNIISFCIGVILGDAEPIMLKKKIIDVTVK